VCVPILPSAFVAVPAVSGSARKYVYFVTSSKDRTVGTSVAELEVSSRPRSLQITGLKFELLNKHRVLWSPPIENICFDIIFHHTYRGLYFMYNVV
jgi:hypothetical protein